MTRVKNRRSLKIIAELLVQVRLAGAGLRVRAKEKTALKNIAELIVQVCQVGVGLLVRAKEKTALENIAELLVWIRQVRAGLQVREEAEGMKIEDFKHTNPLSPMTTDGMAVIGETIGLHY